MNQTMLQQYTRLVDFLGKALGDDYEIVLHDLSNKDRPIVAIANGHISGRNLSSPLTSTALQVIANRSYETSDYMVNYTGVASGRKFLRSSTFYIKDEEGNLVGMLCLNFDDSRFQEISNKVLRLCHPDMFMDSRFVYNAEKAVHEHTGDFTEAESLYENMSEMAEDVVSQVLTAKGVTADRLTQEEKVQIIQMLKGRGVFMLKGAVKQVAKQLGCSQATIYRYLSKTEDVPAID